MADCKTESQFEILDNKLQDIIIQFLNDDRISKLMHYNTKDALTLPDLTDPYKELRSKIYTFTFKPPVEEESTIMYVLFSMHDATPNNVYLRKGTLEIGIATHRNLWDIDNGTRIGKLMAAIDDIVNKNNFVGGLSKEFFRKTRYYNFSDFYSGYVIEYTGIDAQ